MRSEVAECVVSASLEDGKQVFDELAAMLVVVFCHPSVDRACQVSRATCQPISLYELAMIDLPVQCEMLHDADTVAADHRIAVFHMLTSLKQHADDRRARYRFMDLRRNAYVPVFIEEHLIESRPIVRIYDRDTFLNLARHIGRRIHRQIAAFGMAADHNRPGPMASQLGQITRGGLLRGDRATERHHEVLFPPDD